MGWTPQRSPGLGAEGRGRSCLLVSEYSLLGLCSAIHSSGALARTREECLSPLAPGVQANISSPNPCAPRAPHISADCSSRRQRDGGLHGQTSLYCPVPSQWANACKPQKPSKTPPPCAGHCDLQAQRQAHQQGLYPSFPLSQEGRKQHRSAAI